MSNPLVPRWETINEWFENVNSMFGDIVEADCGYIDADLSEIPPFVDRVPAEQSWECFVFNEIVVFQCKTERECELKLIEKIEDQIMTDMTPPRDLSKATIVWRVKPEVSRSFDSFGIVSWGGYARMKVLDAKTVYQNYFTESYKQTLVFQSECKI